MPRQPDGYDDAPEIAMYDEQLPDYLDQSDVMPVDEFRAYCESRSFIDYDGFGHPVKDGLMDGDLLIKPSRSNDIPADATHIAWFNR